MPLTCSAAQSFFDDNFAPWVRALDITIETIGANGATLSMPITDQVTRMGDILSGQALATLADTAMVFACAGHFGEMRPVATTNLDLQFLRPGIGTHVMCHAHILRAGKSLLFTTASMIAAPSDKEIAAANATFFLP